MTSKVQFSLPYRFLIIIIGFILSILLGYVIYNQNFTNPLLGFVPLMLLIATLLLAFIDKLASGGNV